MNRKEKRSDTELYESFLSGDTAAYDMLLISYGDSLTMYLHNYLKDSHMSEDLMIEAFARIMVKKPGIGEGNFKAYLYKTGHNLALRYLKRNARLKIFSIDGMEPEIAEYILYNGTANNENGFGRGSYGDPLDETLLKERQQCIMQCMDRIEPELKEVLWLIYFEKMTYAQTAEVMGVKTKRVERLLVRAREHMRREMKKEGITNAHE